MNKHFPEIVDVSFTADMEHKLDDVEEGRQSWREFLHGFYDDFKETLKRAEAEMERVDKPMEEIDEACPECGRTLVIRTGRFGRFISCSGFPECNYRRSIVNKTGALCPQCGGDLVERKTRQKKRLFYGCSNYPACNFAIWEKPVAEPCPNCGGLMVVPRPGQDAVCYQEVVAPRSEERPQQNGATARRATRRQTATTATMDDMVENGAAPAKTRARTTGAGRTTKVAADPDGTGTARKKTTAAKTTTRKRATTTRASSRKTATTKKSTSAKKTTTSSGSRRKTTGKTVL
jgi:DNA topoisomerase-1